MLPSDGLRKGPVYGTTGVITMSIMPRKLLTLCLVVRDGEVLLGMKKRGFGAGRWNGFGGKVEAGETVEDAARRELREEAGITVPSLEAAGELLFTFEGDPVALEVHVFRATSFEGVPEETEEMRPRWFAFRAIPFDEMWPDDRHWFPLFLAGRRFSGAFAFRGQDVIVSHELRAEAGEAFAGG